jgi:hypothetical protein
MRITHVAVDGFKWPGGTWERAAALLDRLQRERLSPEQGASLGDQSFIPSTLPLLTDKDLQTRFGARFQDALQAAPVGAWSGPFPSRYGYNLVWVHERKPASAPPLAEIRSQVEQRFLQKVADEWLALRLQQLRAEFDLVVPGSAR